MKNALQRLDLNLFRVMDAVHEQGGISSAARQLHLSQPAVSHALARLRRHWGDPLFLRQGNRMVPTELTRRVIGQVQEHLRGLQAVLAQADSFDPALLDLTVRLGMRDVLEVVTLPPLIAALAELAPALRVASVRVPHDALAQSLMEGEVDLVIDRQRRVDGRIRGERLADETLVVLLRRDHPLAEAPWDLSAYFACRHVMVAVQPDMPDPLQALWAGLGRGEREVVLRCQHYFAAAHVVSQSDAVLTLPRTYALSLCQSLPLLMRELPLPAATVSIWMYWHADREGDPAHRWLREHIVRGVRRTLAA